jgi:hypothetical protein
LPRRFTRRQSQSFIGADHPAASPHPPGDRGMSGRLASGGDAEDRDPAGTTGALPRSNRVAIIYSFFVDQYASGLTAGAVKG